MDIYHKVLLKLYEETGGRDSRPIDLQDLVKKMGFPGHFADIAARLGGESWIAEDSKRNYVRITHWGVAEAKKSLPSAAPASASKPADKNAEASVKIAGELLELLKNLSGDASAENVAHAEKKLAELQKTLSELKAAI